MGSKKTADAGNFDFLTCVLHEEGKLAEICDHALPKPARGQEQVTLQPGFYTFSMSGAVSFEKRLIGRVENLVPCTVPAWLKSQILAALNAFAPAAAKPA